MTSTRWTTARVLAWALAMAPAWLPTAMAADRPDREGEDWAARVERLVSERQPTADERRFDEIGWTRDLLEARRVSRASGRPLFLFTHDGRIAIGRC